MWTRALFLFVFVFFVVMNVLLFRSEFAGRNQVRSAIPPELVFRKILTSPDNSFLEVRHHGKKIGTCQWSPSVGQETATGKVMSEELPPEGMVEELTGYSIDLNGNVAVDEVNRLRFTFDLQLSTNLNWERFTLHIALRPASLTLSSTATEQALQIHMNDGASSTERSFSFEELRKPDKVLGELGGPLVSAALGATGIPFHTATNLSAAPVNLKWDAREDKLKVGGTFMRVYRLQTRLLDSLPVVVYVSRLGEILRIELPGEIVVANDVLLNI